MADAAGPPIFGPAWASKVQATTARLSAEVNPNGLSTSYHVDYITKAAYDANVAGVKEPFLGASRLPTSFDASLGSGTSFVTGLQLPFGLAPETSYYYRIAAKSSATSPNYTYGSTHSFRTFGTPGGTDTCSNKAVRDQQAANFLPDCRAYEMISPPDKNGGRVALRDPPSKVVCSRHPAPVPGSHIARPPHSAEASKALRPSASTWPTGARADGPWTT